MSQHERRAHNREVNGNIVSVSRAIVNRVDAPEKEKVTEVRKADLSAALNGLVDIADDVIEEITVEDQIMILKETRKFLSADLEQSAKVGFRADLDRVAAKREFIGHLEEKLEELQRQSLQEMENKIKEVAQEMSKSSNAGFTAQLGQAAALRDYVEELAERVGLLQGALNR